MASSYFTTLLSILLFFFLFEIASSQLSPFSYSRTCPQAKFKIKAAVNVAVRNERRMGASLLRLHFHDCFVNGCDASVLLDDTATFTGEKTAIPNANSLRGFDVIDTIKADLERQCPGVVSCADILAIAARDAVVALGGFSWTVLVGRKDSTTASKSDANTNLPSPFSDLTNLITFFNNKGFTTAEMVALSGSYSIGKARCSLFRNRIYNEKNIEATFAASLKATCPTSGGDTNLSPLDGTPTFFDNNYYRNLVSLKGLLHSDQVLFNNGSTDAQVRGYSLRPISFLRDFANAMAKMNKMGPLTGTNGEIRTDCRKIN